jgi:hypothetical protein
LVDREGKKWYDDEPYYLKPEFPGYTGILNCLEQWGNKGIVNIHTLNHDLYFERLATTEWLQGELCDGFEELGSPYYGKLQANNRSYKVRLPCYTAKYNKKFRLFKLHGSRDYGVYYGAKGSVFTPQVYLKTRFGVGFGDFYKEIIEADDSKRYEDCWVNYHADFLTGTTSKIERYTEPLLYNKLFDHFRVNLEQADQLVIIGYGAKDSEVNNIILKHFDFKNKPSVIIDPYPGSTVKELQIKLGAKLIQLQLETVSIEQTK